MSIILYGLEKCETCKKARKWLERQKIAHSFIDYRDEPVDATTLKLWAKAVGGWQSLVNRSGTTWRNLMPARKSPGADAEWLLLIREYPALVRRPVTLLDDGSVHLGFTDNLFKQLFK